VGIPSLQGGEQSIWSFVNRRVFLTGSGFAAASFTTPVTRWLVNPTDDRYRPSP